ncbi:hypothetical protein [Francisella frigiditurris]|uniref:Uncharacterized protein n=1 Tax=Francisella frigiditurris TaxID=1542390 RepID=A0A1J0KQY2_9GAMM|nr:hypothetical protein [Francisella frigiditurris]APC96197.1 hypothetical protein KX01_847 [Francisella frigiditurris]
MGKIKMPKISEYIRFTSTENIKDAILKGISSFISLYEIQNNKNRVSSTLGNSAINIKTAFKKIGGSTREHVEINEISDSEVEKANRIRASLKRCVDVSNLEDGVAPVGPSLDSFLAELGEKILEVEGRKYNIKDFTKSKLSSGYITSPYAFITLSVFHNACIVLDYSNNIEINNIKSNNPSREIMLYKIDDLLQFYLTPNTKHKSVMNDLYFLIGSALREIQINKEGILLPQDNEIDSLALENLTPADKVAAVMCSHNLFANDKTIAKLFSSQERKKYNKIYNLIEIQKEKDFEDQKIKISPETAKTVERTYKTTKVFLDNVKAIADAIEAYNIKYDENTKNPHAGWATATMARDQYYQFDTGIGRTILNNDLTNAMGGTAATGTLAALQVAFPPSLVTALSANIVNKLIAISFQTNGYGVIHRHGVTGQIRSFLLKTYLTYVTVFIKNHYSYIFKIKLEKHRALYSSKVLADEDVKKLTTEFEKANNSFIHAESDLLKAYMGNKAEYNEEEYKKLKRFLEENPDAMRHKEEFQKYANSLNKKNELRNELSTKEKASQSATATFNSSDAIISSLSNFIIKVETNVLSKYEKALKVLPNKKEKGSLYFYLKMFACASGQYDKGNGAILKYQKNVNAMNDWSKSKLKTIVKH